MQEYINIKIEATIKRKDVFKAMEELGLKINNKNEKIFIGLLKKFVKIKPNSDFTKLKGIDEETLLMYGFELEKAKKEKNDIQKY